MQRLLLVGVPVELVVLAAIPFVSGGPPSDAQSICLFAISLVFVALLATVVVRRLYGVYDIAGVDALRPQ